MSVAEIGAERAENRESERRAVSGRYRIQWSVSGARSERSWSGNGAESGSYTEMGLSAERPCYESAKNCHENANVFSTKAQM